MLRPVRTSFFGLALTFLGLLISPSLCGAENPAGKNLKQLSSGQQVRVVLKGAWRRKAELFDLLLQFRARFLFFESDLPRTPSEPEVNSFAPDFWMA
jgi:hypothetical protein